jgi:hypothetical protein
MNRKISFINPENPKGTPWLVDNINSKWQGQTEEPLSLHGSYQSLMFEDSPAV